MGKNELKALKNVALVIILFLIILFIGTIGRKMLILSDLQKKNLKYATSSNFYLITHEYMGNSIITREQYKKDDKLKIITTAISESGKDEETRFINGTNKNTYLKGWDGDKAVWLNQQVLESEEYGIYLIYSFQITNLKELFQAALRYNITLEDCNEKLCYRVKSETYDMPVIEYIEKETGIPVKIINGLNLNQGNLIEFECEFNKVTDEDFIEPDISEYEVVTE